MRQVHALVPVKPFSQAKSRLEGVCSPEERERLARSMAEHVLSVLHASPLVERICVVTPCDEVAEWARAHGVSVLRDVPTARVLGDVIDGALDQIAVAGARAAIVVMSDLPRLELSAIERMIAALDTADIVLAQDTTGLGTNALAVTPPARIATCFGRDDSGLRHRARATSLGLRLAVVHSEGLAHDLDRPEDLTALA